MTGGAGFVGSALAACLVRRGHEVAVLVRRGGGARHVAGGEVRGPEVVACGLDDPARIRQALDGVDVVYHLAASLRGAPADLWRDAVVATKNLLEAVCAAARPPRVVLVSSFAVYRTSRPCGGGVIDERAPLEPWPELRDPYAQAKLRQERLAWSYHHQRGVPLAVVRPGVVYGPGRAPLSPRVGFLIGETLLLCGGDNLVPLTHVANCAEAIATVGDDRATNGWAFNVHDDDLPTAREIARSFARARGARVVPLPRAAVLASAAAMHRYHHYSRGQLPAPLTPYRAASLYAPWRYHNGRIASLGWRQQISTDEGLRTAWDGA